MIQIRNPKHEIRNKAGKRERGKNRSEDAWTRNSFSVSFFCFIRICFGFRASDFEFEFPGMSPGQDELDEQDSGRARQ
jgi:hypothetical protein